MKTVRTFPIYVLIAICVFQILYLKFNVIPNAKTNYLIGYFYLLILFASLMIILFSEKLNLIILFITHFISLFLGLSEYNNIIKQEDYDILYRETLSGKTLGLENTKQLLYAHMFCILIIFLKFQFLRWYYKLKKTES